MASALIRRMKSSGIGDPAIARTLLDLDEDMNAFNIVELTVEIASAANRLMFKHGLRTGDAIQLASAIDYGRKTAAPLYFISYDDKLSEAARHEGLIP